MFHLTADQTINTSDERVKSIAWLAGPTKIEAGQVTVFAFGGGVSGERGIKIQILFLPDPSAPFPLLPQLTATTIVPQAKMLPNFMDRLTRLHAVAPDIAGKLTEGSKAIDSTLGLVVGAASSVMSGALTALTAMGDGGAAAAARWEQRTITVPDLGWALGFEWRIEEDYVLAAGNGLVGYAFLVFPLPGKSRVQVRSIVRPEKEKDPFVSPYVVGSAWENITVDARTEVPVPLSLPEPRKVAARQEARH